MRRRLQKVSERQREANRANARKSTGPRTEEGKKKSALNALKSTGPKTTAKGKARSAFNALKDGTWSEPSVLRVCIDCRRKCIFTWPPEECIERGKEKEKIK